MFLKIILVSKTLKNNYVENCITQSIIVRYYSTVQKDSFKFLT